MSDGIWRRFLRSMGVGQSFPPPRVESEGQAQAVRDALETLLAHNEDRFRRLFINEKPLVPQDAEKPMMGVLAAAGYVNAFAGVVQPCVRVFFFDDLLIATDRLIHRGEDQVFSLMLEQVFIVRSMDVRKGDRVLELCLGSGVNLISAARRGAARIVGVDVSERALAFAAVNAAVNLSGERGAPPLEMLHGSLFEPVAAADRFDLVLVNPPFELVPPGTQHFLHSHGGEDGLDVVRALLPGVAERLRPGGRFEMFTWTPGNVDSERVTDLVLAAFPGFHVEVRRVEAFSLDEALDHFRRKPGYKAWRDRLASEGITHVWGVHLRASHNGPPGLARIDATEDERACEMTIARWE